MITGLDRANPVNLTNHLASDMDPCWCGNENLAFVSDRDGDLNIYMMSADGASQTRLTDSHGADFAPSCSPDGGQIVYTSTADGNDEIYVMNSDGSGQMRLTSDSATDNLAAWSSDGSKIVFAST